MLDTSRLPNGEVGWGKLLDFVLEAGDKAEAHFLEVKGPLDLGTQPHRAKVAKFLLGVANRQPDTAARDYKGYAVLVVGVGQGRADGVPTGTEHHKLSDSLRRYLGDDYPGFDLQRLPRPDGREVLFIIASPPKAGDPLYPCHASLDDEASKRKPKQHLLTEGAVYVRSTTETRVATAQDIKMLSTRAQSVGAKAIALEVRNVGPIHNVPDLDEVILGLYQVTDERYRGRYLNHPKKRVEPSVLVQALGRMDQGLGGYREVSAEERQTRLMVWRSEWDQLLVQARERFLGTLLSGFSFTVVSPGTFIEEPRLEIRLHGCEAAEVTLDDSPHLDDFIKPVPEPRNSLIPPHMSFNPAALRRHGEDPISWHLDGDDVVVVMERNDLRPHTPWQAPDDELSVLVRDASAQTIKISWRLTVKGSHESWVGEEEIPTEQSRDALTIFRELVEFD
ncbi:hypothetical protein [Nesterenkonia sandarakina]|uniref:DNA-binding protein n=1 Tax=Nesterenkonia sandarakina TaxID=272918 RepID=A0A7Z0E7C8_9MICC|nr:hypothetical protein [Nesterenkonia sandarakina]NYJ15737.1 hypothetical protein [Nesterenkonia sandarakina]